MRKTCKCGVTLSDTIVPNNVVFWTYKATEKNQLIKNFEGEFTDLTQIAIWYCEECKRFYYWGDDGKVYTYALRNEEVLDYHNIDWEKDESLYYSFNDFEEEELRSEMKRTGELAIPRKIKILENRNKIAIKSNGNEAIKLYQLENVE
ncbi:MAG: hypothetical protein E7L01_22880 [Paenibacillus macerans]|uniref:Uncharacterized protein n=1 Tax=Paenibacillus macerans TaxID=44252 RepID=A0A090Y2X8_PAEMA|nr:hypothetical protein [Paenibacillus macerans]KFM93063.1 hypothetical protein DJ90_3028 [Paenibacillus macerans]MBS5913434.1 hypothetical protein [Paenibacillus macerans]MDU5945714.1 hypothetical protein [Paenibacillus macerans]MDU7476157.1 hypothetical protein [Paenibacillus macerans]MEC0141266.1 hypothetical protein [Paenibacillus macerans]